MYVYFFPWSPVAPARTRRPKATSRNCKNLNFIAVIVLGDSRGLFIFGKTLELSLIFCMKENYSLNLDPRSE